MPLHDKNKLQRQTNKATVSLFDEQSRVANTQVVDTVSQQALDLNMFKQTAQKRVQLNQQKSSSNAAYGELSSKVMVENDQVQAKLLDAQSNPFHNLMAFFTGDESTDDLMNRQRAVAGKLNRINMDNIAISSLFDEQIAITNQGLKDQLGLSDLRSSQGVELDRLLSRQSAKQKASIDFQNDVLVGKTIPQLQAELRDVKSPYLKGLVVGMMRQKESEVLDNTIKKRNALKSGKVSLDIVLGYTGASELKNMVDSMDMKGLDMGSIEGLPVSKGQLTTALRGKREEAAKSQVAIDSLNQEASLQSTLAANLQSIADKQDITNMSPENVAKFRFSKLMNDKVNLLQDKRTENKKNGIPITQQQFNILATAKNNAISLAKNAIEAGAQENAAVFQQKNAHESALNYFRTGKFESTTDARNVYTELALTETPTALANESLTFGKLINQFTKEYSDALLSEFPDITDSASAEDGVPTGKINLKDLFANNSKTRKINFANSWNKTINAQAKDSAGNIISSESGEETNKWVSMASNLMNSLQVQVATGQFLDDKTIKLSPEFQRALFSPGGGLKQKYLNADVDTLTQIASDVAAVEAELISQGKLPEDSQVYEQFMAVLRNESITSLVKREFEGNSIALNAIFRPLYGKRQNMADSYMVTYEDTLRRIDALDLKTSAKNAVIKPNEDRKAIDVLTGKKNLLDTGAIPDDTANLLQNIINSQ